MQGSQKNVLVTGATGHLGNNLVRQLLQKSYNVTTFVLPNESKRALEDLEINVVYGDIRDFNQISKACEKADIVFHLAAIISILQKKDALLDPVNVQGTQNILEACSRNQVKRLVYTSSVHAIAEPAHGSYMTEACPISEQVLGHYAKSKARAAQLVLQAIEKGLDAVIVHPSGIVGPFDFSPSPIGQMIIDYAHRKLPAYVEGAYDYVDVRSVASGIIAAAEKAKAGERFILSGEKLTVSEMMMLLEEILKIKRPKLRLPMALAKVVAPLAELYYRKFKKPPRFTKYSLQVLASNPLISSKKAQSQLNYKPIALKQTFADTVQWFKSQGVLP